MKSKIHEKTNLIIFENGDVYSQDRYVKWKNSQRFVKGTCRPHYLANRGYVIITHGRAQYQVHNLVAECFILNPNNLSQINHIDGNKLNNHASNLEWCTNLQNTHHRYRLSNKKRGVSRSGNKWMAKLTVMNNKIYLGIFDNKEEAYEIFYNMYLKTHGVEPWTEGAVG